MPKIKKWFMLQVWRLQQVAQILTLVMLSITLSLTVFDLIKWREDSLLSTSWIGVPVILLLLFAIIMSFAMVWDLRLKMWRDQATVLMERNPYVKEKMTAKEIMIFGAMWLPLMDNLGKTDPKMREAAEALRQWLANAIKSDEILASDVRDILDHIGKSGSSLLDFMKK